LLPSPGIGSFGGVSQIVSLVPNTTSLFDMAVAVSMTALLASFTLMLLGLLIPADAASCTWVNPSLFPYVMRKLLMAQAE
ncbi:unnamed protein product, partial [Polarella glacialis]